ncbi:MAG TPA: hypothetical protein VGO68_03380 [Pyrinomonadaceae bacterium]|jgi:hypothetical protein|nr:hypothetical protein [Pyrinomonadaceae bacterium]
MNREELSTLLNSMLEDLAAMSHGGPVGKLEEEADLFMINLFRLGVELHSNPSLGASEEYERFLEVSSEGLARVLPHLNYFIDRFRSKLYGGSIWDWKAIAEKRSGLAFLFELYRDTPFAEFLPFVEMNNVDTAVRTQAAFEGYVRPEEIPAGLPVSHWWWRPTEEDLKQTS